MKARIRQVLLCLVNNSYQIVSEQGWFAATDAKLNLIAIDQRNGLQTGTDLYAQKLDSAGYIQWQTDGVPVCMERGT